MWLSRVRRLAHVLVVLPVLQLVLLASDGACAPASADPGSTNVAVNSLAPAHGHHAHHAPAEPEVPTPAHIPAHEHTTVACPMAMACSAVAVPMTATESATPLTVAQTQGSVEPAVPPATLRGAPEPPPPRV